VSVWFLIFQGDEKGFAEAGANLVCNNPERLKDKMDALYFWKPQKELVRVRGRKVISFLGQWETLCHIRKPCQRKFS
jgi:hypothetical protein